MFPERIGSGLRPYRKHREKARFKQPTAGGPSGPVHVVGGLTSKHPLYPKVGNLSQQIRAALPRTQRYAAKGTSPSTEPAGSREPKSRQYVAAARRTRQKFRRR
jgi:hypothetical protein